MGHYADVRPTSAAYDAFGVGLGQGSREVSIARCSGAASGQHWGGWSSPFALIGPRPVYIRLFTGAWAESLGFLYMI